MKNRLQNNNNNKDYLVTVQRIGWWIAWWPSPKPWPCIEAEEHWVSVALVHLEEIWKITRMRAIRCSRVRCTHRPYVVCYMHRHIVAFVFLLDVSIGDPVYLPRIHAQAAVVCHKRRKFPSVNGFFLLLLLLLLALVLSYYFWFLIEFESHAANSVYFSPK